MSKVNVEVSGVDVEGAVRAEIQAAITKALTADPEALVRVVVNEAMHQKKNSYDHRTVFEASVVEMIQEAGRDAFKVWLAENGSLIQRAIEKKLVEVGGPFVEKVAEKIVAGLAEGFRVSVTLPIGD